MLKGQFLKIFSSEDLLIQEVVITVFTLSWETAVKVPGAQRRDIWVSLRSHVTHGTLFPENQTAAVPGGYPLTVCEGLGSFRP